MEIFTSNFVKSSFENVLHSYNFYLVSTYKYKINNRLFDSIYVLFIEKINFRLFKWGKIILAHLNLCLLLITKKASQYQIHKLDPKKIFDLHQNIITNEHRYVTKMAQNVSREVCCKDFIVIFWILIEYLQRPIYVWNKILKCIRSQCEMDFQSIPLHTVYNFQHFKPIEFFNGVLSSFYVFQQIIPKWS
jgi:hypothetical protein